MLLGRWFWGASCLQCMVSAWAVQPSHHDASSSDVMLVRAAGDAQAAVFRTATGSDALVASGSPIPGTPWYLVRVLPLGQVQLRKITEQGIELQVELPVGQSTAAYAKREKLAKPVSRAVAVHELSGQEEHKGD